MSTETTGRHDHVDPYTVPTPYAPAVRRGIDAVGRLPGATYLNSARATLHALCAALELEEMARRLFHTHDDNYALDRRASWDGLAEWERDYWRGLARGLRAAILGTDS